MSDRATIMKLLESAAERGFECPSNGQIAGAIGHASISSGARWVAKLEKAGLISVERGSTCRVVTIRATGKKTAGAVTKPHWRLSSDTKAQAAAEATRKRLRSKSALPARQPAPETEELTRVDRDPCPRCGVRGDIGCAHRRIAA